MQSPSKLGERFVVRGDGGQFFSLSSAAYAMWTLHREGMSCESIAVELLERHGARIHPGAIASRLQTIERRMSLQRAGIDESFRFKRTLVPAEIVNAVCRYVSPLFQAWVALVAFGLLALFVGLEVHGGTLREVRATDAVVAYVLFLLSLLLHEFGHAGAAYRFGARPSDIGVAMYVFIPAFYSDVTEAWALRRRHRVIVDLGGSYMQMLLSVPLLGLDLFVHAPVGLLTVIMICGSFLYNLNPLFKSDGYWAIADALGKPWMDRDARTTARVVFRNGLRGVERPGIAIIACGYVLLTYAFWATIFVVAVLSLRDDLQYLYRMLACRGDCGLERNVSTIAGVVWSLFLSAMPVIVFGSFLSRLGKRLFTQSAV